MAERLGLEEVGNALHAIRLDCLLEGALAAFDCDLIASYEERQAWWWISAVARHRVELGMVDWGHTWCRMWSAIAEMMFTVSLLSTTNIADESYSLPMSGKGLTRKKGLNYDINGLQRFLRCGTGGSGKRD
jgi:hypothetical protein